MRASEESKWILEQAYKPIFKGLVESKFLSTANGKYWLSETAVLNDDMNRQRQIWPQFRYDFAKGRFGLTYLANAGEILKNIMAVYLD
ncbi:hypothetical protein JW711_02520 [Candidatus Woesearchaeota archaeon]|nr:hypothetical protein [Candidatus Woesearchaeota archaeon]